VRSTLAECASAGIATFGAGGDLASASKLSIHQAGSLRIGLLGLAEREYCIAGPSSPGAAPIGAMEFVRAIRAAAGLYDRLIVLLHAGKEHVPFPPPALRDLCRFIIEEGASAVLCQHSHCPGWFEDYRGGLIVYGQGNLLFDPWPDRRPWLYDGYLVKLVFEDQAMGYELIPHEQRGESIGVRLMNADDGAALLARLRAESAELADPDAFAARWNAFCRERARLYFSILRGHGRLARKLNAHTGFANAFYSKGEMLDLYNVVRCETHREMLETLIAGEVDRTQGNTSH
jgi:poly-gamma-glutamate synthesis protein (capsule biosynthesis protein)